MIQVGFSHPFSVIMYANEGGSMFSNDAFCASIPPTNLKNNKILLCKINPVLPVFFSLIFALWSLNLLFFYIDSLFSCFAVE